MFLPIGLGRWTSPRWAWGTGGKTTWTRWHGHGSKSPRLRTTRWTPRRSRCACSSWGWRSPAIPPCSTFPPPRGTSSPGCGGHPWGLRGRLHTTAREAGGQSSAGTTPGPQQERAGDCSHISEISETGPGQDIRRADTGRPQRVGKQLSKLSS